MDEVGQYLTDLPEERIARYRLMGANARKCAEDAISPEVREAYTAVARSWETMATEYERTQDAIGNARTRVL